MRVLPFYVPVIVFQKPESFSSSLEHNFNAKKTKTTITASMSVVLVHPVFDMDNM